MCTGILLKSKDGVSVFARTMEWGAFDLNCKVGVYPRNYQYDAKVNNKKAHSWRGKYGFVGIKAFVDSPSFNVTDGMNEKGLSCSEFYHPGFANPEDQSDEFLDLSVASQDLATYMLSMCETVEDVKGVTKQIHFVESLEPSINTNLQCHYIVTDATGKSVILEFQDDSIVFYDNVAKTITNSPTYPWHLINMSNYLGLTLTNREAITVDDMTVKPLGVGTGYLGLPGDFTPTSRFVRASMFVRDALKVENSEMTMTEAFRILDNFNVPVIPIQGQNMTEGQKGLTSSTAWTACWDLNNLVLKYHTQFNRRTRELHFADIDFNAEKLQERFLDEFKNDDTELIVF